MIDLILLWLWYLLAFGAGVVVMGIIVMVAVKPRSEDEAIDAALAKDEGDRR